MPKNPTSPANDHTYAVLPHEDTRELVSDMVRDLESLYDNVIPLSQGHTIRANKLPLPTFTI